MNKAAGQAFAIKWAGVWFPTIAGLLNVSLFATLADTVVVLPDNGSHVRHTAIAYLNSAAVEYFAQLCALRKVLVDERQKLSPDIRLHIFAIRRIEPGNIMVSCSFPLSFLLFPILQERNFFLSNHCFSEHCFFCLSSTSTFLRAQS